MASESLERFTAASTFTVTHERGRRTVISAFGLSALLPLLLHLLGRRVVDVGLALSEQLFAKSHDGRKVVAGVGELVWMDLEHGNIFQDHLGSNTHVAMRRQKHIFGSGFHLNVEKPLN